MDPVSLSASESLKSKILRRVREAESETERQQGQQGRDQEELSSETMDTSTSGHRITTRKQSSTGESSRPTRRTRKTSNNPRSLRASSRTQIGETQEPNSQKTSRGRARGRRRQKSQIIKVKERKKEALPSSSLVEALGNSREAKPQPARIKRRLRSSTSLVSAPLDKVRRVEDDSNASKPSPRSPSPSSATMKTSWLVPESPCSLVIVEKKSQGHQRKISVNISAEAVCFCTDGASCGHLRSTKSGRKKKSKVRPTKRTCDSCPVTETLSKNMVAKSNLLRNGVSKQKKKSSDADANANRRTRRSSKAKDGKTNQVKHTSGSDDQLNFLLQESVISNSVAALSSVIGQTSPEIVRKEHGTLVKELINKRINQTLTTQNDPNNVVLSINLNTDALTSPHQLTKTAKQNPPQSDVEATTNSMTVTKTAATEAAKAVGGIALVPLYKGRNPDFLPTVLSPCTSTVTVMKASSDQTMSCTISSESNLNDHKTQVSRNLEAPPLSSVSSGTGSCLQAVAQCKCVASVSTVPTPSLMEVGSIAAGQPVFLSPESFQFQTVSHPGMVGYNLLDTNSSVRLPKSSSKLNKKKGNTKKKSVEKEPRSSVSNEIASSSTFTVSSVLSSSPSDPDTRDPNFKDPSLDDKGVKIKRPMNAFMIWSRQQRSILAGQRPKMTNADISVKLGVMWNDMDYDVKQTFFDEAIKLKLQHRKDYPDWVYQPRPQKRQSRRKRQPSPFYGDGSQQIPYNQMVLVMPDGRQILCPAMPQQNQRGPETMMTNFASNFMPGPAVDVNNCQNIPQPNKQAPEPVSTNNESNVTARPPVDVTDVKNSANQPSEQSTSKMLVLMPDGQQVLMYPGKPQQNCQETGPVSTNITSNVTPGPLADVIAVKKSDNQHPGQSMSKMVLVMPDGKQVLCPAIPGASTDVNDVKENADQPCEQSKSAKEKLVLVRSEKSGKCGNNECMITFKGKSGLSTPAPINLGPVIQLAKDTTSSNKKTAESPLCISDVKPASSNSHLKQQQMANVEKKMVTSLQMAIIKDLLGTSQDQTEPVVTIPPTKVQSGTSEVMETKTIRLDAKPFPAANTTIAQVQLSYQEGNDRSIAKSCDPVMMMLSNPNQQCSLTEISSLLRQPVNNQIHVPTQNVSNSLNETDNSSRLHPVDDSSRPLRQTISLDNSSRRFLPDDSSQRFVPDDSSQLHSAVTLVPLDLQEPALNLQPMIKNTGVQTLQDWSSCSSNDQNDATLQSHFPSSVLKNQPIDMLWTTDPRIVQLPNISHKGTSTSSYPFYFTPVQQVSGVQNGSTAPLLHPPALPATIESCMVPLSTASLTESDPSDVGMPPTQFAETPTLCEISEPDRLLESLAMSGVEISEDEAEETENLFQRVMNMVSN